MPSIEGFRAYARLDDDEPIADACYAAAIGYGEAAGIPEMSDEPLYDMFVYAVALHFYDNRGFSPAMNINANAQNDFVDRWITKLKIQLEYKPVRAGDADGGT